MGLAIEVFSAVASAITANHREHVLRTYGVTNHRVTDRRNRGFMAWAAALDVPWRWAQFSASAWACHWQ
jgi:hypothetical protein